ncbi:alpha/beta fold hydrolase [Gracilimonas sp. BCB1]|uniref:alpha/beta fold hydrolase n=1 Tax=Gracilimonas sp. BCB1 TaxID=3152362 RepID=UPI0032D8D13A
MNRIIFIGIIFIGFISCSQIQKEAETRDGFIQTDDGAALFYQVQGMSTDTLLIIHGGPGAGINSFSPSAKPLAKDFTLIFYDQRGGGKSTLPEDTTRLKPEYFVEDLEAVRDYFNLDSMNVLTHSFGSIVLAEYATKYPHHLNRVVFHGSTGPVRAEMGEYYRARAQQASPVPDTSLTNRASTLLASLLEGSADDPVLTCREYEELSKQIATLRGERASHKGSTCDGPAEAVKYYYQYTAQLAPAFFGNWDYSEKLKDVKAPLLVVYGKEDSLAISSQRRWTDITQNSRLLLVPEADKGSLSDNPGFTLQAITTFFRGSWPEQAEANK